MRLSPYDLNNLASYKQIIFQDFMKYLIDPKIPFDRAEEGEQAPQFISAHFIAF